MLFKKLLITGSTGMLGTELSKVLNKKFNVFTVYKSGNNYNKNSIKFDLRNKNFNNLKKKIEPDIIIHCAALTNVDFCEKNKRISKNINYYSTKKLSIAFPKSKIIFISSDAVFSSKIALYENCKTDPINYYGFTKLLSEEYLQKNHKDYCIIRATPIGFKGINNRMTFLSWITSSLKKGQSVHLFSNNYFNPVTVSFLSLAIKRMIKNNLKGIFHIGSNKKLSKYEFGMLVARKLKLNVDKIRSAILKSDNFYAKRNTNQFLQSKKNLLKYSISKQKISQVLNDIVKLYNKT